MIIESCNNFTGAPSCVYNSDLTSFCLKVKNQKQKKKKLLSIWKYIENINLYADRVQHNLSLDVYDLE